MASKYSTLWKIVIAVVLFLGLLVAGIAWLVGTESGARTALSTLTGDGKQIAITGIQGRLAGPLIIERLTLEQPDRRIVLHNVRLDWRPAALARRVLHVKSLRAERLQVVSKIKQESEPAKLPDSILLPVEAKIDRLQIDQGDIAWGPMNVITVGALNLSLDYNHERYRLQLHKLAASSESEKNRYAGNLTGAATLSTAKPYEIQASFTTGASATFDAQTMQTSGSITLGGSLAELVAATDLSINNATIRGRITAFPFSEQALGATSVNISSLDLAAFSAGLPRTLLDAQLGIDADGSGQLVLKNQDAGLYSAGKVPLVELRTLLAQQNGEFLFRDMSALLGTAAQPAGRIHGNGGYRSGGVTVTLNVDNLNLHRLHDKVQATRLNGKVELRHAEGSQQFAVDLTEPFGKNRARLVADGTIADERLEIGNADMRIAGGELHVSGHLSLAGQRAYSATGRFSDFRPHELGQLAQLPAMQLNGDFSLQGKLEPALNADLSFNIFNSRLADQPLRGEGRATLRDDRLAVPRLFLMAGDNRLDAQGALAKGDAELTFQISAPHLEQLGAGFSGAVKAQGSARGTVERPRIDLTWTANQLRLPGMTQIAETQGTADFTLSRNRKLALERANVNASARQMQSGEQQLDTLSLRLQFAPAPGAPLVLDLNASGLRTPRLNAARLTATIDGTTARHTLTARLEEANNDQTWTLGMAGGLRDLERAMRWQGTVERLDAQGRFTARLDAPAPLTLSAQRVQLDRFQLSTDSGYVVVDRFMRDAKNIVTRGSIERLSIAQLLKFTAPQPAFSTDLQMAGDWDLAINDVMRGEVNLRRVSGDIVVRRGTPTALGLERLDGTATVQNGMLQVRFNAEGRQLGRIELSGRAPTDAGKGGFALDQGAPLTAQAKLDIPSLAWVGPMISHTVITAGRLQADLSVAGTIAEPKINGVLNGRELRLTHGEAGIDLRQGALDAEFRSDTLILRQLAFKSANGGSLLVSGPFSYNDGNPIAQMAVEAERFMLLNRSDRKLVLSGISELGWTDGHARVTGSLQVNSGYFDIGREDMPQLSDDVVIVGREEKGQAPVPAYVDLAVDLGNEVVLTGRGIDAVLTGQLRVTGDPGEPLRAFGSVRLAKGTFSAYGRELAIERGVLRFNGALNNPILDFLAMRRDESLEVEAGVAVRGTVLAPRVTLVSEPAVPDADKLSWLVLGRGLDAVGNNEMGRLQDAAGKLLEQGALGAVQSRLASAFGLDDFSISTSPDNVEQRIVTLGKRLSSRLYVSFKQGIKTTGSVLLLRYDLTENLTVEAEAGTRSALSLLYNIAFD